MLQVPELARCCEAVIASNVSAENVADVHAMAKGEASGAALVEFCEGFALRHLPSKGPVEVLKGLPAARLRSALKPGCALREMWEQACA